MEGSRPTPAGRRPADDRRRSRRAEPPSRPARPSEPRQGGGRSEDRRPRGGARGSTGDRQSRPTAARRRGERTFFAVVAHGLEHVLAAELTALGIADAKPLGGGVGFSGALADAYAACLWSRTAERVLLQVARFPATTRDELYDGLRTVDWTAHLSPRTSFACSAIGTTPAIRNSHFAALLLKDAVVDQIRDRLGDRPSVNLDRPDIRLQLLLRDGQATVSVDLAGEALHRRGYRTPGRQAEAPIKETLAAGVLLLADWQVIAGAGVLLDPLCGSGTLVMEAALMAADAAPGLARAAWGFRRWGGHEDRTWQSLREAALARREAGMAALAGRARDLGRPPLAGSDRGPRAVALARASLLRAGLEGVVSFDVGDIRDLRDPFSGAPKASDTGVGGGRARDSLMVTNPPYGARLAAQDLDQLYSALGETLRRELNGWHAAVLVADERRAALLGTRVTAGAPRLRNGPIDCTLLLFEVSGGTPGTPRPSVEARAEGTVDRSSADDPAMYRTGEDHDEHAQGDAAEHAHGDAAEHAHGDAAEHTLGDAAEHRRPGSAEPAGPPHLDLDRAAGQFRDRLRRNVRVLGRPLRRRGVDCYRLYDADLPDFNMAVDLFADWAHVQEYRAPAHIDPAKAAARLAAAVEVVTGTLDLPPDHVVVKLRQRQRGRSQYERLDSRERLIEVHEGDAAYLVNLTDRIDTGLFLDQRLVRELIGSLASGSTFLNLFGYTGAATVAAALGGARRSLTVDLSRVYLEWAGTNFAANDIDRRHHRTLRADVTHWLREAAAEPHRYDLILLGPPTFSNSAGMRRATLDVQRDHVDLLRGAARLLTPGGTLLFVSGAHRFVFAADKLAAYSPLDLSARTLPADFSRRAGWHHVWRLTAPGQRREPRRAAGSGGERPDRPRDGGTARKGRPSRR